MRDDVDDGRAIDVDIERWIPQRLPMRIVEGLLAVDDVAIETIATVRDGWPTADAGQARTSMLIELLAQTAAALQGWRERHEKAAGEGGLLVGIHGATLAAPRIPVGTKLVCVARISHGAPSYLAFDGEIRDDQGTVWLTGSIQAFRPEVSVLAGEAP